LKEQDMFFCSCLSCTRRSFVMDMHVSSKKVLSEMEWNEKLSLTSYYITNSYEMHSYYNKNNLYSQIVFTCARKECSS
jgi:hypothetical protein